VTTIVEADPLAVGLIQPSVPGTPARLGSVDQLVHHLQEDVSELVVVLGPSVCLEQACLVAEQYRAMRPALAIVLVRECMDSSVLAAAMRSGVREVVATDDVAGLTSAVRRAEALARALSGGEQVGEARPVAGGLITVFSTKGGVGKTVVSTNLGAALADLGHRVCIVDLDVESGDAAVMLSLVPERSLGDLARIGGALDEDAVESLLTRHSDRLSVLAAPPDLGVVVAAESVGQALALLKGMFDVVVVDTGGSFDGHTLQALDHSDLLVLVGTLDQPALKNLRLAVGTLDLLNYPRDLWRLALNRADPRVGLSVAEFEKTLGVPAAVTLTSSRDVLVAVNRGETLVRSNGGHSTSRTFASFAARLSQDISLPGRTQPHPRRTSRRATRVRRAA
jgi:pilus assembly protein CpaE